MFALVTGNPNKKKEFEMIFAGEQIETASVDLVEIQSMDLREIVEDKVRRAYATLKKPVVVEDVSFEIACMNGFPGPFIRWWADVVGHDAEIVLAEKSGNWAAKARSGVGYFDGERFVYAEGIVSGRLTPRTDGEGWGFDFYFIPEGHNKSFAQMGPEEKNKRSHRGQGLRALRQALAETK